MSITKIATCCYCGTRAALVLDQGRHELVCSSCGAPLHEMKMLRKPAPAPRTGQPKHRAPAPRHTSPLPHAKPRKKTKKRRSTARWLIGEIFDVVEDILD